MPDISQKEKSEHALQRNIHFAPELVNTNTPNAMHIIPISKGINLNNHPIYIFILNLIYIFCYTSKNI